MYDTILIATDGSEDAQTAIDHGISLANHHDATVEALYVIETKAHYILTVGLDGEEMREYEEYGEQIVSDVVEQAEAAGVEANGVVKKGRIAEEIVNYANDNDADLIVMGAVGRSAVDKYLVGSTTEKVVRTSEVPVTTVRGN